MRSSRYRSVWAGLLALWPCAAVADTIFVDADNCPGPGDGTAGNPFCSIQDGIDAATAGDVVEVAAGTYQEHVQLASGISVVGEDAETTIIDGGGTNIDVVRGISVSDVEFRGFTVTGAISGGSLPGGAGVFVNFPSATVVIRDVIATGNDFGIAVFNGFNNSGPDILDCVVHGNTFWGISGPGNGLVAGCVIFGNRHGIHQSGNSTQPQIIGNTIWGNIEDGFNYWNDFAPLVQNNIFAENGQYGIQERAPGTFVDPIVEFNLFWNNGAGNYFDVQTGSVRNTAAEINGLPNATSNLVDDPLLCDPPLNFHLGEGSPAEGAGEGGADIGALPVDPTCGCPWDLDGSGVVGTADLLDLLAQWGADPGGPPDFDGNGIVGTTDLLELLANWGPCVRCARARREATRRSRRSSVSSRAGHAAPSPALASPR